MTIFPRKSSFFLIFCIIVFSVPNANATPCVGKFTNPINDICWSCIFPLSIGNTKYFNKRGDNADRVPAVKICKSTKCASAPCPCLVVGYWEPARLADVTRTPYCMVSLGGITFGSQAKKHGGVARKANSESQKHSFYHTHWYMYPLIYWMELLMDHVVCYDKMSFDLFYMSEFDPLWSNDELNLILNPEAVLFGNPIAQAVCALDCAKASIPKQFGLNPLFWCAGCNGSMYPYGGFVESHVGGVQASSLIVERLIARLHRVGLAWATSGPTAICDKHILPLIKKDQYKLQMTYPRANTSGLFTCNPIGRTTSLWQAGRELPANGEDFAYLVFRKRNCCI